MLNEEDVLGNGFLDPDASRYLLSSTTSSSINRSLSMPLQLGNPWNTDSQFEPVVSELGQHSTTAAAVDDDILGAGVTAASVLVGIDLPEIYNHAYLRARPTGERVTLDSLEKVIALAELPPRTVQEIMNMVVPAGAMYVTHNEFNTALALAACAQKSMEVSLHNVYQHRNDLPSPVLLNLDQLDVKKRVSQKQHRSAGGNGLSPKLTTTNTTTTTTAPVDDPWSTTTTTTTTAIPNTPVPNGNHGLHKDTTNITATTARNMAVKRTPSHDSLTSSSDDSSNTNNHAIQRALASEWFLDLDVVSVTVAPEREGFIFKHINYVIESQQRSSKVLRRYSDFYWLWEILTRRFPIRAVPNLPPKKVGGKDDSFLEKRRKGLLRFINAVVRHPELKRDEVVDRFLTEPSELLAWRRANPPANDEEFVRESPNINELAATIPKDLDDRLNNIKARLPNLIEHYSALCNTLDRQIRWSEMQARELTRYSITLNAMSDLEGECYVSGCQSCTQVARGYDAVAKHMQRAGSILDDQSLTTSNGVLENLKRHRDHFISFKEMLERKEKLQINQIDSLSKKIQANRAKVNQNRGVPGLEAEVERLDNAIASDQAKLIYQQERDTHIRYCVASELSYIHKQQAFISHMYQTYVAEQLQFSRQFGDNWKVLQGLACEMPIEPDEFA